MHTVVLKRQQESKDQGKPISIIDDNIREPQGVQWMVFVQRAEYFNHLCCLRPERSVRKNIGGESEDKISCPNHHDSANIFQALERRNAAVRRQSSYLLLVGCCRDHSDCKHHPGFTLTEA